MDDIAVGWLHRTASKNLWRVQPTYEFDDLIQEGYWIYYKLKNRYDAKDKRHIMSLFQRSYTNHMHFLAKKRTRLGEVLACDLFDDGDYNYFWDQLIEAAVDESTVITNAPEPLKSLLKILVSDEGIKKLSTTYRVRYNCGRETFNDRLCRMIDIDPDAFDLPLMLKEYLMDSC